MCAVCASCSGNILRLVLSTGTRPSLNVAARQFSTMHTTLKNVVVVVVVVVQVTAASSKVFCRHVWSDASAAGGAAVFEIEGRS